MSDDLPDPGASNRRVLTGLTAAGTGTGAFFAVWFLLYGLDLGPVSRPDAGSFLVDWALQLFSGNWEADRGAMVRADVLPWFALTLWVAGLPAILGAGVAGRFAWRTFDPDPHHRGARLVPRSGLPKKPGSSETARVLWFPDRILLTGLAALIAGTGVFLGVWFLVYGRDLGPVLRADAGTFLTDYVLQLFSGRWDAEREAVVRAGVLPWFTLTLWVAGLPAILGAGMSGRRAGRPRRAFQFSGPSRRSSRQLRPTGARGGRPPGA